jgi:hypothetical protein
MFLYKFPLIFPYVTTTLHDIMGVHMIGVRFGVPGYSLLTQYSAGGFSTVYIALGFAGRARAGGAR